MPFYDMAVVFNTAFNKSATHDKPVTGFRACGLWPYDSDVFTDDDFAAALLTGAHQATAGPSSDDVPTAGPLLDGSSTADPSCDRHPNESDEPPSAGPSYDDHATTDMPADEMAASLPAVGCVASTPATTVIRDLIRNISPLSKIHQHVASRENRNQQPGCRHRRIKTHLRRKVKHLSGRVKEAGSRRGNDRCLRKKNR